MIYRLKNDDGSIVYPFVKEQLRSTFPNTSFPFPISDETAAEHGCLPVQTIEHPDHDPRTQRLVEGDPEELEDGTLRQVLTVRDATEDEIAAWDASNQPSPDWSGFKAAILTSEELNAALVAAMPSAPTAVLALPSALMAVAEGRSPDDFRACWLQLRRLDLIPQPALDQVATLASDCHLPADLIGSLGGGGTLVRAHNPDGTFTADDPSTPENEAWVEAR